MIQRANTTMIQRFALLLLLSCASLPLLASEGRMDSPDGEGDRQAAMVTAPGDAVHGESPGDAVEASREKASESAPADTQESSGRPPRMHNLIPGMFR